MLKDLILFLVLVYGLGSGLVFGMEFFEVISELVVEGLDLFLVWVLVFWLFNKVANGFDVMLFVVFLFIVVVFNKGFWMFLYMRLSMLNFLGEDLMLFIVLLVFRIILRISLGFLVVFNVCRSMLGLLSMWLSLGFRLMMFRIWGLFIIKLRMILGLFMMFWMVGVFIIFFIMLGFWVSWCCICLNLGSLVLNNLDVLVLLSVFKLSFGIMEVFKLVFLVFFMLGVVFCVVLELLVFLVFVVMLVEGCDVVGVELRIMWIVWFVCKFLLN